MILVTGCAGFIGWKVVQFLLSQGCFVVGVDNINEAYDPRLKHWRLEQIVGSRRFTFYRLDILDFQALEKVVFHNWALEAVINLAARVGVRQSVENPRVYFDTNVIGTLNLLDLCRRFGVKKFILASTSSLYGSYNPVPFREDANTDQSLSPYAASKKAAEVLCYTYHHLHNIDVTILRYFTVYGPAGRPDMSLFRFVHWISEGKPVYIYGDGSQARDFTYIDDITQGTLAALKPMGYEVINLGSDRPVVLIEAVRLIEEIVGRRANIVYLPGHPADMPKTWADIAKAKRLLGWNPETPFYAGVAQLVSWYQENREWVKEVKDLEMI